MTTTVGAEPGHHNASDDPRILVVGGGFAGVWCAKHLVARFGRAGRGARVQLVSPQDYLLYTPLLAEVAGGSIDPRNIAVSLARAAPGAELVNGLVESVDLESRSVTLEDGTDLGWDRLVLAPGSVTQLHDVPGARDHALGLKTFGQAVYLRDHLIGQLEESVREPDGGRRAAMRTVVVVGASYAGSELVGQLRALADVVADQRGFAASAVRFVLVDLADRVMPEIGASLADRALRVLQDRGIEVRLGTTVSEMDAVSVTLDDGTRVPTETVAWVAGVRANPLVDRTGLPLDAGRVVVDPDLHVPGHPDVFAIGDAAAVPDLADDDATTTAPTAQHATRQGRTAARNVAASLGVGTRVDYLHHDLGLVVDLGPGASVANPLGAELSGLVAKLVTRGYHLAALPGWPNRVGVALDWLSEAVSSRQAVHLGLVRPRDASFRSEHRPGTSE